VKIPDAIDYVLGLTWGRSSAAELSMHSTLRTLRKYGWLLSGLGAFGGEYYPGELNDQELRGGTNIGIAGLVLALAATIAWRREPAWLWLGWGLFGGNLAFVIFHARWDNLTFTIPGTIGLSLLVGLGTDGIARGRSTERGRLVWRSACLIVPAFLLLSNGAYGSRNTPEDRKLAERREAVARAPFPEGSVVIATYWPIMGYRFLLNVQAGREDINIIQCTRANWPALIRHFEARGQPVFIPRAYLKNSLPRSALRQAPPPLARLGLVRAVDVGLDP